MALVWRSSTSVKWSECLQEVELRTGDGGGREQKFQQKFSGSSEGEWGFGAATCALRCRPSASLRWETRCEEICAVYSCDGTTAIPKARSVEMRIVSERSGQGLLGV